MEKSIAPNLASHESYVIQVDGQVKLRCSNFAEALKVALQLKLTLPESEIKLQ